MTTPDEFMSRRRSDGYCRGVSSLADFLEAVKGGEDVWGGSSTKAVSWLSPNGAAEYDQLKSLGWSAGSDYGAYGCDWMYVYSPHPKVEGSYTPRH